MKSLNLLALGKSTFIEENTLQLNLSTERLIQWDHFTTSYASNGHHAQRDNTAHYLSWDKGLTCCLYFLRWKLLCALVVPNRASPTSLLHSSSPLHVSTDTAADV